MKRSKRYTEAAKKVDRSRFYALEESVDLLKELHKTKFDESVEVSLNLGVNPKHADQMVRGTVSLPNGTGKKIRVLVINRGEMDQDAKDAGADYVGFQDYLEKISDPAPFGRRFVF